ncbi:hypothetical protein HMPREF9318_00658 [Streptococcus urinalis FB127-CNA-2]|uniref:PF04816 family protein n=1 Tax=Streptococcus urinalis 2285-97 TaxID=764291 RepID=G5KH20_9STRE|nr:tRNA (adenine(22)-N(1))-methyltransferase TrmK [Streptococcus urinalis]EHJ57411.1 hypothetical protein STRUR_1414 [Streptococcus urinalis 2285-97]EKS22460.1 hypothetical protein HMPREF9318_00658 [Streptococcus urinalis FB127-CNA-2]VEF32273.1 anthranilate synthase component I [Streptococcus urinalis]
MEKLSKRLSKVAEFVPKGAVLLDVGSDHAYLPIYLVSQNQINSAIAGEVVAGPYQSALSNINMNQLNDKINARLANGLDAFNENDSVNVITICGMGGRLIVEILENGKSKLANIDRLILQPNNREDDLRNWLIHNHFKIIDETILSENDKFYEIIIAEKGSQKLNNIELRFGPKLLEKPSDIFKQKWLKEMEKLEYALRSIPESNQEAKKVIQDKLITIKGVI